MILLVHHSMWSRSSTILMTWNGIQAHLKPLIRSITDDHAPMKSKVICLFSPAESSIQTEYGQKQIQEIRIHYWEENRRTRNHVVNIRNKSMRTYFKENCSKHDNNFWAIISPFFTDIRFRNANDIILHENDNIVTDPSRVSELFNDDFSSVAMDIGFDDCVTSVSDAVAKHISHPSVVKIRYKYHTGNSFSFKQVTESSVALFLRKINPRKATGYDHIPGKTIRIAHQELSSPITSLINSAISANAFPSVMKCAEISPGFKKDDDLIRGSYRPVSVLPILSKIHESVTHDQLFEYFLGNFHDFLCAFRRKYSCQSLLLKAVDDWKYVLDQNLFTRVVFMDLSKILTAYPMDYWLPNFMRMV